MTPLLAIRAVSSFFLGSGVSSVMAGKRKRDCKEGSFTAKHNIIVIFSFIAYNSEVCFSGFPVPLLNTEFK